MICRPIQLLIALGSLATLVSAQTPPGAPWRPELSSAFESYYAGRDGEVQELCLELRTHPDPVIVQQAALLDAFTRLRSDRRDDRSDARLVVSRAAREDPAWDRDPECHLAMGLGYRGLLETSDALQHLTRAVDLFHEQRRPYREQTALVELARAWTIHTEWERPPPGLGLPVIGEGPRREDIRRQQLALLRQRCVGLPGEVDAQQAIDLAWAQYELKNDQIPAARARLQGIVDQPRRTATWSQAALTRADLNRSDQRALLQRLTTIAEATPEAAEQARQWLAALDTTTLNVTVPMHVRPNARFDVVVNQQQLKRVEWELRRVDLSAWIASQNGRYQPARLPTAGALVRNDTLASDAESFSLELARGAYVLLCRGVPDTGGAEVPAVSKLVIATDLVAHVVTGVHRGAIWTSTESAQAQFWMHGSFVGQKVSVEDGVGQFRLPPERAVLTDTRWLCLLRAGEDQALCTGRLAPGSGDRPPSSVALTVSPHRPKVGDLMTFYGLYVRPGERDDCPTITLDLVDAEQNVRASTKAVVRPDGSLLTRLRLDPSLGGATLAVVPRIDNERVEILYKRPRVTIAGLNRSAARLVLDVPSHQLPDKPLLEGTLRVTTPSGVPLGRAIATLSARAVALPDDTRFESMPARLIQERLDAINPDGTFDVAWPVNAFDAPEGVLAVGFRASVEDWDNRTTSLSKTMLIGPEPAHLWLSTPERTETHRPVPVWLGWTDPTGLATTSRPRVTITKDGQPAMQPAFLPTPVGLYSADWVPTVPGTYLVQASLDLTTGATITRQKTVTVNKAATDDTQTTTYDARLERVGDTPTVLARVLPPRETATLVVVDDGDPVALQWLPPGASEVRLTIPEMPSATARLRFAAEQAGRLVWLADQPLVGGRSGLTLEASVSRPALGPGRSATVEVHCPRAEEADVMLSARLVTTAGTGVIPWIPNAVSSPEEGLGQLRTATSLPGGVASEAPPMPPLHPLVLGTLFEGDAVWIDSREAGEVTRLRVPLPDEPGRFLLLLTARGTDGSRATTTVSLDTSQSLALQAELPEQAQAGDRFSSWLELHNPADQPFEGRLRITPGRGLALLDARREGTQLHLELSSDTSEIEVSIPPGTRVPLTLTWEATQPGRGLAKFVLSAGTERLQVVSRTYTVASPATTPTEPVPFVRRIYRVEAIEGTGEAVDKNAWLKRDKMLEEFQRVELAEDELVPPGTLLLMVDEWDAPTALGRVKWSQTLPVNAVTMQVASEGLRTVGRRQQRSRRELLYEADSALGRQIHETVLVTTRAGSCEVPMPEATAEGVPIRFLPVNLRVVVPDSTR